MKRKRKQTERNKTTQTHTYTYTHTQPQTKLGPHCIRYNTKIIQILLFFCYLPCFTCVASSRSVAVSVAARTYTPALRAAACLPPIIAASQCTAYPTRRPPPPTSSPLVLVGIRSVDWFTLYAHSVRANSHTPPSLSEGSDDPLQLSPHPHTHPVFCIKKQDNTRARKTKGKIG